MLPVFVRWKTAELSGQVLPMFVRWKTGELSGQVTYVCKVEDRFYLCL